MPTSALATGEHGVPAGCIASVVTYLQRKIGPLRSSPKLPGDLRLEWASGMSAADYKALFKEVGGPWLWFSRLALSEREITAVLQSPKTHLGIVYESEAAIGFIELDSSDSQSICLSFLGVKSGYERKGLGGMLLEFGIKRVYHSQVHYVETHTCTLDHPASLRFYQKCGFKAVKQTIEIAPDPRRIGLLEMDVRPGYPAL